MLKFLKQTFEKKNLLHIMASCNSRECGLWMVNMNMFLYYICLYTGYITNSLSTRFLTVWIPCTIVNLTREYLIDAYHGALPFTWGAALALQCYFFGLIFVWFPNLNIILKCTLFTLTMTLFCVSCYNRYKLSNLDYHRYAIGWEILISINLVAPFLAQDILINDNPDVPSAGGTPYVLADVFLKMTRTMCLYCYYKGSITKGEFKTQGSWFTPLSSTSFEAVYMQWNQTGPDSSRG